MKPALFAAVISLGLLGATGVALAASSPPGSGKIYTEALNIMSSGGYHGIDLISQNGNVVHATAMTHANKPVSLTVNTATGTVQSG
ncbi:MAG: hypothetical protein ACREFO_13960 [Acetobacteraceae bacterium]